MDIAKSAQNLAHFLPQQSSAHSDYNDLLLRSEIDRVETIYGKPIVIPDTEMDAEENLPFLKTYHNMCRKKDGKVSFRSPYTNKYYPPLEDGAYPSPLVRNIEEKGRILFQEYAKMYYGENWIANFFVEESE